jgi:hypothetical protein
VAVAGPPSEGRRPRARSAVAFDDADDAVSYHVVNEIARRVLQNGGEVLAVRRDDVPGESSVLRSCATRPERIRTLAPSKRAR